jgi:hypothetical protein
MWTLPDLNPRETATLVWAAVLLAFVLRNRDVRRSAASLGRILFRRPIRTILVATMGVATTLVTGLALVGYWRPSMVDETLAWFVGTGVVATFNSTDSAGLRRLLTRTVALVSIVEFLTNAYTFPLLVELALVPTVFFLIASIRLVQSRREFAAARRPLAGMGVAVIVGTLTPAMAHVLLHPGQVATTDNAKAFLLPVILTACFLPYLYGVRLLVVRQTTLAMLKHGLQEQPELYRYAKCAVIRLCGISLARAQLFESEFRWRMAAASSHDDLVQVLDDFRVAIAQARQWRNKRRTPADDGSRSWRELLLPTADMSNVLTRSVTLADRVQEALAKAAASSGELPEAINALYERMNARDEFAALSPVARAEMIQALAEQHRSIIEIELMAPPVAMLATLHNVELGWLTKRFDELLRLAGEPATNAREAAEILHNTALHMRATFREAIDAFITVYGGNIVDAEDGVEVKA